MNIAEILSEKYIGAQWNLVANDYDQLTWDEKNEIPKPSLQELEQKWHEIEQDRPTKLLRKIRDDLLSKTDKYTTPDYPHATEEAKQAWLDYRQALRDLPSTSEPNLDEFEELTNVSWPTPPE